MPTPAQYIAEAQAAGIPYSAIQQFLSGNPNDEHRLMSALGPDYIRPQVAAAAKPLALVEGPPPGSVWGRPELITGTQPAGWQSQYATPTPETARNETFGAGAGESRIYGSLPGYGIGPPGAGIIGVGSPASSPIPSYVPTSTGAGIPMWMIVAAAAVVLFLMLDRG